MEFIVRSIPKEHTHEWILKKHYAHRMPSISFAYGLFDKGILVGICSFGNAIPLQMKKGICGKEFEDIVYELNRLCLNDDLPKNSASFLVSRSLKLLPKPKIIVSYSDMAMNHHGYIYQATNFIYTGIAHIQKDWKVKGLENKHSRTLMDEFKFQKNRIEKLKQKYGDRMYQEKRPPKHRYIYFLGDKRQVKEMRKHLIYDIYPYPKGDNVRYSADYKPNIQEVLF